MSRRRSTGTRQPAKSGRIGDPSQVTARPSILSLSPESFTLRAKAVLPLLGECVSENKLAVHIHQCGTGEATPTLSVGGDEGASPMKSRYLVGIAIAAAFALYVGAVIQFVRSQSDYYCPPPSAASVATLFAPCQAFESAMGHRVSKQEAVQMGLLAPDQRPEPATQLADPGIVVQRLASATRMIGPHF